MKVWKIQYVWKGEEFGPVADVANADLTASLDRLTPACETIREVQVQLVGGDHVRFWPTEVR